MLLFLMAAYCVPLQRLCWITTGQRRRDTRAARLRILRALPVGDAFSRLPSNSGVCLGKFDALHRGHQALVQTAGDLGFKPWLISFSGMAKVLGWEERLPLVAPESRADLLKSIGAQERVLPFAQVQKLSPREFVDLLVDELGASAVVCGSDFRFGFKARGNATTLQTIAKQRGIKVGVVPLQSSNSLDVKYSSTLVRQCLAKGDMLSVAAVLGRPYRVFWRCCLDIQGGLQLSDPANQLPEPGVYNVSISQGPEDVPATIEISGLSGALQLLGVESNF